MIKGTFPRGDSLCRYGVHLSPNRNHRSAGEVANHACSPRKLAVSNTSDKITSQNWIISEKRLEKQTSVINYQLDEGETKCFIARIPATNKKVGSCTSHPTKFWTVLNLPPKVSFLGVPNTSGKSLLGNFEYKVGPYWL